MLYYFSGTGNSRHVAERLASLTGDSAVAIGTAGIRSNACDSVGFVFPIHAWRPPQVMLDFIGTLDAESLGNAKYFFMVATCGDDVGLAAEEWRKALSECMDSTPPEPAIAAFSVQMPNTYVAMPGFDVDSPEVEQAKLAKVEARLQHIAQCVKRKQAIIDVNKGVMPWIKTRLLNPWFVRHKMTDSKFNVDATLCIACGKCATVCPLSNILADAAGRPTWHGKCAMCLACLHHCPQKAINWAKATQRKGRYVFKESRTES